MDVKLQESVDLRLVGVPDRWDEREGVGCMLNPDRGTSFSAGQMPRPQSED
jgi:hypothetical protein